MTQQDVESPEGIINKNCTFPPKDIVVQYEESYEEQSLQKKKKRSVPIKGGKSEKKPKVDKIVGDDAEKKILQYMKQQNRPYSVQNVFDNLHSTIGKTLVQKIMDKLAQDKQLLCKEYGKFKVYLYDQNQFSNVVGNDESSSTNSQINDLKKEVALLESKVKEMKPLVQKAEETMKKLLSIDSMQQEILADEKYLNENRKKESRNSIIDPSLIETITLKHRTLHDSWWRRKKACQSIIQTICPMLEMSMAAVNEELGLDTDESCIPADAYKNY